MAPIEHFWNEFCRWAGCRACLEQVLTGERPPERTALLRLLENGYLVEDQGRVRLRVPLLAVWLRRYRDVIRLA